jgi:hypothetical protein
LWVEQLEDRRLLAVTIPGNFDFFVTEPGSTNIDIGTDPGGDNPPLPTGFFGSKAGTPSDPFVQADILLEGNPPVMNFNQFPQPLVIGWVDPHGNPVGPDSMHKVNQVLVPDNTPYDTVFTFDDLDIDTTIARGFRAISGSGAVNVTGTTTTIDTTTGRGIEIQNTNIGASGITVDSISTNGADSGIFLRNTGAVAGSFFSVTGNGNTALGGNGSGGNIRNGSTGVSLENVQDVRLVNLNLNNGFDNFAIRGTNVNGFKYDHGTISGTSGDSPGTDEGEIRFTNLTGTATINGSQISGGIKDNLRINNDAGALDRLTIDGSSFTGHPGVDQNNGVTIEATGTIRLRSTSTPPATAGSSTPRRWTIPSSNPALDSRLRTPGSKSIC